MPLPVEAEAEWDQGQLVVWAEAALTLLGGP
jgi:hypothetical protein